MMCGKAMRSVACETWDLECTLAPVVRFALVAVAFVLASCSRPADPAAAARQFFEQLAAGKTQDAYASSAFGFQAQQPLLAFQAAARDMGLVGASSVEVAAPELDGNSAKLDVTVTGKSGARQTLLITLQQESGAWRIFTIRTPRDVETGLSQNRFSLAGKSAGLNQAGATRPMPDEATIRRVSKEAVQNFAVAIKSKSFEEFYSYVSAAWQAQLTQRKLHNAFQAFMDRGIDLTSLGQLEPVFDEPPQITSDGLLVLSGHYEAQPFWVHFSLKFMYELPDWKLFGIDVNLRKPPEER